MLETVPEIIAKASYISKKLRKMGCRISPEKILIKCDSVAELNFFYYRLQPIIPQSEEPKVRFTKIKTKSKWIWRNKK